MSTSPQVMPPPGASQENSPVASPAPAESNPALNENTQKLLTLVRMTRQLAKDVPAVADEVRQINDLLSRINKKMMQQQSPGQPAAPPV